MGQASSALAYFLAVVLVTAAVHKLVARDRLARATGRLLGLNVAVAMPVMFVAAAVEACAALALLLPATRQSGALLAAALWVLYAATLYAAYRRGDAALDCGCSFGSKPKGIDGFTRMRPVALAVLAIIVALLPTTGTDVLAPFAGLAFFAMYLAAAELAALPARNIVR